METPWGSIYLRFVVGGCSASTFSVQSTVNKHHIVRKYQHPRPMHPPPPKTTKHKITQNSAQVEDYSQLNTSNWSNI
jgi:hypothetical protein